MNHQYLFITFLAFFLNDISANMRFASPLQALTIWDTEQAPVSPRDKYLVKLKAGLEAERKVREELKKNHEIYMSKQDTSSPEWAAKAVRYEKMRKAREERLVEKAYDEAVRRVEAAQITKDSESKTEIGSKFQFVGVVNNREPKKPVTWYSRPKPPHAKWSLRLLHVNRDAIIKDLFDKGKVDLFAKYSNEGFKGFNSNVDTASDATNSQNELIVKGKYLVRERSWRTLWNFSPKNFFTDSSGMYWRERRLPAGLYTDGTMVYETTYRYKDGRNGIRKVRSFSQFLQDTGVDKVTKDKILKRLQSDAPDIVIE